MIVIKYQCHDAIVLPTRRPNYAANLLVSNLANN